MATFTMELRSAYEVTGGDIGLNDYPIFDADYREKLNEKILAHFWFREIGQETVDQFRFLLARRMNEIMPLYNQLYKSELLAIDPFLTFSSTSAATSTGSNSATGISDSTATNTTQSDGRGRVVGSETPQSLLAEDGEYATSAQDSVSGNTASGSATDKNTTTQTGAQEGESSSTASGFSGAQSSLLIEYRQTFLNIDMQVIEELNDLFMLIWNVGDAYTRTANYYPFGVFW